MLGVNRAAELATSLLHIGGLSGAAAHLAVNDPWGAVSIAAVGCLCVMLLTAGLILTEVAKVWIRQFVRRHELTTAKSEPRNLGDRDA